MTDQGKIGELREALVTEFGYGKSTIDRLFRVILGKGETGKCINCDASMAEYDFTFDYLDAQLILAMANVVRHQIRKGKTFNEANAVHAPSLDASHTVKCRTTQSSKLGLIAKYKVDGTQDPGKWLITKRGWSALRGEEVPRSVRVFRGKIQERFEKRTTLGEALMTGKNSEKFSIKYDPKDWYEIAGYSKGSLI